MTRFVSLLLAALVMASPAAAQVTTSVDDSIAIVAIPPPNPSIGVNSGFGGMLGEGPGVRPVNIRWDTDVLGNVSIEMVAAECTGSTDRIVFYLDSTTGGFPDTTGFTDVASLDAAAVSATPRMATLTFPPAGLADPGFLADFAISLRNESGGADASFYELVEGGGHVFTALTVTRDASSPCGGVRITGLTLSMLRMAQGASLHWFGTLLNATNGFRSNEFHGVNYTGANIGMTAFALGFFDYNRFTSIGPLLINEVDADSVGSDALDFIELFGPANARLDGVALVAFNGNASPTVSYSLTVGMTMAPALDLDTHRIGADGYFVLGQVTLPERDYTTTVIQGGPDAVALYLGEGAAYPNGSPVTTANLIDGLIYTASGGTANATLQSLLPGQAMRIEGSSTTAPTQSNQRCPNGSGGPRDTSTYRASVPSPGAANLCLGCGNGVVESGEQCDDGAANGTAASCCLMACTFRAEFVACTGSDLGVCDRPDTCNATGTCVDRFEAAGSTCRAAAAGSCDVAEVCDGSTPSCPANGIASAGTTCRAATTLCDVAEVCDGSSIACPTNDFAVAGTECRAPADLCDASEVCSGASTVCPVDQEAAAGTVCRPGADACDPAETCDGSTIACPGDVGPAPTCCVDSAACDDGDVCTLDLCSAAGGTCSSAEITNCCEIEADCDDGNDCTTNTCNASTNRCEVVPVSGCCDDNADCDDTNVCTTDTCTVSSGECGFADVADCCLSAADCDDGDSCTTDSCDGTSMCAATPIANCCAIDADCDDGFACTTDTCDGDACSFEPIPDCTVDGGTPDDDGGTPGTDGGTPGTDAGTPGTDAGGMRIDAGVSADAGPDVMDGGCTCRAGGSSPSSGGGALIGLAVVALFLRRRSRG